MELTGKAKEDFYRWYLNHIKSYNDKLISNTDINYFNLLTDSMKYGVYVDWFDSVGIVFWVSPFYNHDLGVMNEWAGYDDNGLLGTTQKTRQEARTKAIEKANEIYNNQ